MPLEQFEATVECFDPGARGDGSLVTYVLPVDSPDEEHAVSAAMSNAVAFTTKVRDGQVLSVAFRAVAVRRRASN